MNMQRHTNGDLIISLSFEDLIILKN